MRIQKESEENSMGFVSERVRQEDRELFNSFELVNKTIDIGQKIEADEHSFWKIDRERNCYFIMTGVIGLEGIEFYTLVLDGQKVNITAGFERRFDRGMQKGYKVCSIVADKGLESRESEYLELIKEALLVGWENGLDFIEFDKPRYREGNE